MIRDTQGLLNMFGMMQHSLKVSAFLLKVPMDPFTYRDTCSAVGAAAREGDCELLYRLIQEGKPIDVRDNRGWSPLHEAAAHNSSKCMKVLLAFMEDPDG